MIYENREGYASLKFVGGSYPLKEAEALGMKLMEDIKILNINKKKIVKNYLFLYKKIGNNTVSCKNQVKIIVKKLKKS